MGATDAEPSGTRPGLGSRLLLWRRERPLVRNSRKNVGYLQLRADFTVYREEFDALVAQAEAAGVEDMFWRDEVEDLCDNVETALEEGHIEDGWRHFHAARRMEIYGLEAIDAIRGTNLLQTRARVVRQKALEDLGGHKRATVEELLGRTELKADVTGEEVRAAAKILHKQYGNVHLKRNFLQRQFNQLFWLGVAGGIVFILLSVLPYLVSESHWALGLLAAFLEPPFSIPLGPDTPDATPNVSSAGFAVFVLLAGIVGASLFGMRSLRKETVSTKVTQQINGLTITWARGFFGAISAMLLYFALQTPFVTVGGNTAAIMIVVGFSAGYSERMVT